MGIEFVDYMNLIEPDQSKFKSFEEVSKKLSNIVKMNNVSIIFGESMQSISRTNPLIIKFLSKELIEFLGDFVIEPAEYSKTYVLRCKDGRTFHSYTSPGLLDEVERAYNKYLMSKDWGKDAVSEKSA